MKAISEKTTAGKKRRLVLLDAHAIIHRAYHALPEFTSPKGEPTGALYGLSGMLLKLLQDLSPDYIIAAFDLPDPTYRHEAYDAYKAGRKKIDDALAVQIDRSRDVFTAFSIPLYEHPGFEADDILGTIVEKVKKEKDLEIIIASGDMDTLQLVEGKRVQVYTMRKGMSDTILYNEDGVMERFGFPPKLLPDYKGLRGDPSDNIIGVKGIGEKTATDLITSFGSIEDLYTTLKKTPQKLEAKGVKARIIDLLRENEEEAQFSKMLATIRRDAPIDFALPAKTFRESIETSRILDLFSELGFRTLAARVRDVFSVEESEDTVDSESEASEDEIKKIGIAVWLLDSDITNPDKSEILQYAGVESFSEASKKILALIKERGLEKVYEEIELPLIPIVEKIYQRGVSVDTKYLGELSKKYHKELDGLTKKIYREAGGEFNINSPKQLSEILFEKMGLRGKNMKKTGTGLASTRESELEKIKDSHPIVSRILLYRELQKLLSTYIDNIPGMVDAGGRLHTQFVQTGTTTGRMSSQNPNLQNIPIRTELGKNIRNAFIASPGFTLVTLDYSQIELRVAAFLSKDEKLIDIFKNGRDVHTEVAAQVFQVPPEMVDYEMRRRAKVINFGILYGMGVNALRQNLGTTREEAQNFYDEYFKNFSGLSRYFSKIKIETENRGYTETYFGRRRYFGSIRSPLPYIRAQAERMAINAPIQGTEADIIKIAMIRIEEYVKKEGLESDVYLLLQVHDELVYEIKEKKASAVASKIKEIMESVLSPEDTEGVPLAVSVGAGENWGEIKKL